MSTQNIVDVGHIGIVYPIRRWGLVGLRPKASLEEERRQAQGAPLESWFQRFIDLIDSLTQEVYGRRPFSEEPAKVLWERAASLANEILEKLLLQPAAESAASLEAYLTLSTTVDDLCNRWIGFQQSIEGKVLVHSFEALFGWAAFVLIAGWEEDSKETRRVRNFLLLKLIQRRLYHADWMVPLETLRVINSAILRALYHVRSPLATREVGEWSFRLRPSARYDPAEGPILGLYDLMTMLWPAPSYVELAGRKREKSWARRCCTPHNK